MCLRELFKSSSDSSPTSANTPSMDLIPARVHCGIALVTKFTKKGQMSIALVSNATETAAHVVECGTQPRSSCDNTSNAWSPLQCLFQRVRFACVFTSYLGTQKAESFPSFRMILFSVIAGKNIRSWKID